MKCSTIETKLLILKPLGLSHLSQKYVDWLNDPLVYKYLETGGDYSLNKLKTYLEEIENNNIHFWAIHSKTNDKHIGNIKIDPIDNITMSGEYGILIGDRAFWGKGIAKEASIAVIDYCFKILKLNKITLGVLKENSSAIKLYEQLGFSILTKHLVESKHYVEPVESIRMALLNDK